MTFAQKKETQYVSESPDITGKDPKPEIDS